MGRRAASEAVATAFLVAAVVGSGIMAARLAPKDPAIALLANTIATGAALVVLIITFGPISGAHMNPLVTLADGLVERRRARVMGAYVAAQLAGGLAGAVIANLMFDLPAISLARQARQGTGQLLAEFVATFGLLTAVLLTGRHRPDAVPYAVGGYITAAYWFTASTSFANPAVTLARTLSDTFTGIRPADVLPFIAAQVAGAVAAVGFVTAIAPTSVAPRRP